MANADNLKKGKPTQFKSGEEAAAAGRKGGIASGKSKREKANFRKAIEEALSGEYATKGGHSITGVQAVAQNLIRMATDPHNRNAVAAANAMFKIMGGDKSALDEAEQIARIEQIKANTDKLRKDETKEADSVTIVDDIGGGNGG